MHCRRSSRRPWWPASAAFLPSLICWLLLATSVACGEGDADTAKPEPAAPEPPRAEATAKSDAPVPETAPTSDLPTVVFLGDSLTAGYGLPEDEAYPALIDAKLHDDGFDVRVVNAGVSGDTSAGGLARLEWVLSQNPDVLVVGLGGNDGLRGLPLDATERNLRQMVIRGRAAGARVIVLGMKIPPNYGFDYAGRFERMYGEIADELDVPLVPFLLEGVAARPALNQADRIHPNARGHRILAETVYPYVEEELEELE